MFIDMCCELNGWHSYPNWPVLFTRHHRVNIDIAIWWMTPKNNRAPPLFHIKLCASFQSHWWIQTWIIDSIWVKINDFCVTLKFNICHWKTLGHLFCATPSFVRYFVAISEFKLELESGNAQFGSISAIFQPVWPRNLTENIEKQ